MSETQSAGFSQFFLLHFTWISTHLEFGIPNDALRLTFFGFHFAFKWFEWTAGSQQGDPVCSPPRNSPTMTKCTWERSADCSGMQSVSAAVDSPDSPFRFTAPLCPGHAAVPMASAESKPQNTPSLLLQAQGDAVGL